MINRDSLISNLAVANIHVDDMGICHYNRNGKKYSQPLAVACSSFMSRAKYNCVVFYELWNELVKSFTDFLPSYYDANDSTQSMFANVVKQSYSLARRFPLEGKPMLKKALTMDISVFSEGFMLQFVDRSICMEWVYQLICCDLAVHSVLEKLSSTDKKASGSMGDIDLKMEERVYLESEYPVESEPDQERLHPLYTRKFQQYDIQHGMNVYDLEDRVYRLFADPYGYQKRDERQPNRSLSRIPGA